MKQKVLKLTIEDLTPEKMIETFIDMLGFEKKPLDEYTQSELIQIIICASNFCTETILNGLGLTGTNLQEQLDQLIFSAKKDSSTSSMRPSSDMPRRQKEADPTETDVDPVASKDTGASATSAEGTNSTDSEETESEEQYRRNKNKGFRKPSEKPVGRPKGTTGCGGFQIPENAEYMPDQIIPPDRCTECPRWGECRERASLGSRRNVVDMEIKFIVTPYRNATVECPEIEDEDPVQTSQYPENVNSTNQYGINIVTLVTCMYCIGMTSLRRIQSILGPMLKMTLAPATMLKYVNMLAEKIKPTVSAILDQLHWAGHVHCDETGGKINGEMYWLHTICTEAYTFLSIQKKRGREGMDEIGFLLTYTGTVIHDCLRSYWSYQECTHATCNEHILRELKGVSAFFKNASAWADEMSSLLREMLHTRHLADEAHLDHVEQSIIDQFSTRFDAIIAKGKELHPIPEREPGKRGAPKKGRARSLIDRMELRKPEIFRFITDLSIPFTNNIAESSFRIFAAKRNEMGSFRSYEDAENFVAIMAYLSTARKHDISYYDAVKEGFLGNSSKLIFPNGLPKKRPGETIQMSPNSCTEEQELLAG